MTKHTGNKSKQTQKQNVGGKQTQSEVSYILCGHVNLHHSDACNAQFVKHVNSALQGSKFDGESFIAGPKYGFNRRDRPLTVHDWSQRQQADQRNGATDSDAAGGTLRDANQNNSNDNGGNTAGANGADGRRFLSSDTSTPLEGSIDGDGNPVDGAQFQAQLQNLLDGIRANVNPDLSGQGGRPQGFIYAVQEPHVSFNKLTFINNGRTAGPVCSFAICRY